MVPPAPIEKSGCNPKNASGEIEVTAYTNVEGTVTQVGVHPSLSSISRSITPTADGTFVPVGVYPGMLKSSAISNCLEKTLSAWTFGDRVYGSATQRLHFRPRSAKTPQIPRKQTLPKLL